ncbi:MAG TPA: zf-HC2 domain-containing protein [Terriglobia bacterium]|nr:zf-HC2 domain-containing protein [Terriglobia bacterium]
MTHLEVENLASDYLEGRLEAARLSPFQAHLATCARCQETVADVRRVMELCQAAEDLEPAPWLVAKIMRATVGERVPTLRERIAAYLRPVLQPRVAYTVAMAVFSFSFILNAAGVNLRHLTIEDLNPRTWVRRADRSGHLMYARAEKFCYDLRVVYEIESRLRQLRPQSAPASNGQEEKPKQDAPGGGTSDGMSGAEQMASLGHLMGNAAWQARTSSVKAAPAGSASR